MEDLKYKTGFKRLGAAIVDGIVFSPLIIVELWLFESKQDLSVKVLWTISMLIISLFYSVFLHYKFGQTVGKWVVGVKVLDISESKTMSIKQSIMRDSFYLLSEVAALIYFAVLFNTSRSHDLYEDYRSFSDYAAFIWIILELISMTTNSKRRAVHDFLAGSVVVRVKPVGNKQ